MGHIVQTGKMANHASVLVAILVIANAKLFVIDGSEIILHKPLCKFSPATQNLQSADDDENGPLFKLECNFGKGVTFSEPLLNATIVHNDYDEVVIDEQSDVSDFVVEVQLTGLIGRLTKNTFSNLQNLRILHIESEGDLVVGEHSLDALDRLTSLTINVAGKLLRNDTKHGVQFPGFLQKLLGNGSLRKVSISGGDLQGRLNNSVFAEITSGLEELSISNSPGILLLDEETDKVQNDKLEKLELESINADNAKFATNFFARFRKLQYVRLENVTLSKIVPESFANSAETLTELRLPKNSLRNLDNNAFSQLKKLKILDLSGNQLTTLPAKIFDTTPTLEELYLKGNHLQSLPHFLFARTNRLERLDLSDNLLTNFTNEHVAGLEKCLQHLELSKNRLRNVWLANVTSTPGLSVADNGIVRLTKTFFQPGSKFFILMLSGNPLDTIDVDAFENLGVGSGNLYMHNLNITYLDLSIFAPMRSYEPLEIYIGNCTNLRALTFSGAYKNWPKGLDKIFFMNNPKFVMSRSEELENFMSSHRVAFVYSGQALCSCRLDWLKGRTKRDTSGRSKRSAVIIDPFDEPATCCNVENMTVERFLLTGSSFETFCNGTSPLRKETTLESCPRKADDFSSELEEPEAKK